MDDDVKPDASDERLPLASDDAADLGTSDLDSDPPLPGSGYVGALPPAVTYRLTRAGDPSSSVSVFVL